MLKTITEVDMVKQINLPYIEEEVSTVYINECIKSLIDLEKKSPPLVVRDDRNRPYLINLNKGKLI